MKPIIGPAHKHDNLWLAIGHAHQGFTLGPTTGRLLADLIFKQTPFVDPQAFSAQRFKSFGQFTCYSMVWGIRHVSANLAPLTHPIIATFWLQITCRKLINHTKYNALPRKNGRQMMFIGFTKMRQMLTVIQNPNFMHALCCPIPAASYTWGMYEITPSMT